MKLEEKKHQEFKPFKTLKAHVLPLTNCCFNKNGDKYEYPHVGSSQAVTIEPAKSGTHNQEICCINCRDIKMQSMPSPLTSPLGTTYPIQR